jgi:hypothetical protein
MIAAAAAAFAFGWWVISDDGSDETADADQAAQVADEADEATDADAATENPIVTAGFPTGRFVNDDGSYKVMRFSPDGTYVFNIAGFAVQGTYTVDGDLYTELTNDVQPLSAAATYRWSFDDGELTFELVGEDTDPARRAMYTGPTHQGRVFVQTD